MSRPIVQGVSVLSLLLGGSGIATQAQGVSPNGMPRYFARPGGDAAVMPPPLVPRAATSSRGMPRPVPTMARAFQEPAPAMPTPTPATGPAGSSPSRANEPTSPNPGEITLPRSERAGGGGGPTGAEAGSSPSANTEPTSPNPEEITLPRSERAGGGGGPTEAEAAAEEPEEPERDETKLLMNTLGIEDSPVKIYGWIQNSFTGNTNGTPPSRNNFGVAPNTLANSWMGNQYYLIIENPLEQNDRINFGFRVDNLFGHDWQFNHMHGLFDTSFEFNHFAGYDPAQMYAEVHLPYLTKGGIDVKGGRFYTILGYEVVPATGRPLLSVPYMFTFGQPFTHFGFLSTLHLTDRINLYNGAVNGWDRWINESYKWNYLGGFTWTSKDGKANLAVSYIFGPNQFPRFLNPDKLDIIPTGTTTPPYLAGRRNLGYGSNWRTMFTEVFSYKWTDKLTQVLETDQGFEDNIPGLGPGGTNSDQSWQSFGNWFLYNLSDKLTGVWRSEVFRDNDGARTGFADTFYEMTLGMIYKPVPYIWIRPEARYDWAQFKSPYSDGTRGSQFTLAVDAILLY